MGEKENYCNCSLGKQRHSGKDGAIECFTPSQQLQKLMFYLKYQTGKQGRTEAGGGPQSGNKNNNSSDNVAGNTCLQQQREPQIQQQQQQHKRLAADSNSKAPFSPANNNVRRLCTHFNQ